MKTFSRLWHFLAKLLLELVFQINVLQKIKTRILCLVTFFRKSCREWHNVDKYCVARDAEDDNMGARWILDL
jgi:hypothetical protein